MSLSRFLFLPVLLTFGTVPAVRAADSVTGTVVDQLGRALPRAYVRTVDTMGRESAATFADETGRFQLTGPSTGCRVEVSLTGFKSVTLPCGATSTTPVVLSVAPIQETTIVTATRTDAPTSQAGASATIFTTEDLERRQTPLLADLLTATPGAMVVRSGGPGSLTSLFVRGGESNYNKVLLDGVPLNEPGGTFYLNNLSTEGLERVEIVRGAYSSLFGSDAMASVIQLFTRHADLASPHPRTTVGFDGGTYDTLHTTVGASGALGRFDYGLAAARFTSDNRVPNSGLQHTTLSANTGVAINDKTTLRFVGRGELEHVGTPGTTAFGRPDLDAFFDRHDGVGSVSFDQQITRVLRQRASYSLAISNQQSTNLNLDPPYRATFEGRIASGTSTDFLYDSRTNLRRHHLSYQADWRLASDASAGAHLLTVLADWDGERAAQEDRRARTRTVNARDNVGVAVQDQVLWRRLFVTLGGRIEHNESFGTAFVPRTAVVFIAHESSAAFGETRLKASIGKGIKEPTMLQSFSLSPFFLGNPDLKPERSRSAEIGVEQRVARDRVKLEITYFHNRFADIISLVTTDPNTFAAQFSNVGLTRARGLEALVEAAPASALRARAGYTFLDSKILESATPDDTVFGLGQRAFRRPKHSGYAGLTLKWSRVSVDVNGVFIGRFVDSDFGLFNPPLLENPGHTTWDSRLALALTSQLTATLSVDNLTNRDYSEPFGYQPLLRAFRAGLRVAF